MNDLKITRRDSSFDITIGEAGPILTFRYLSIRKFRKAAAAFDAASAAKDNGAAVDALVDVLRSGLRNWSNLRSDDPELLAEFDLQANGTPVELPYRPDLIDAALELRQMEPIARSFMQEQNPPVGSLPNSSSPASSQQAESVTTVNPVDAAISAVAMKP